MDKPLLLSITITAFIASCSDNKNAFSSDTCCTDKAKLNLSTRTFVPFPFACRETFFAGDEIGLYLFSSRPDDTNTPAFRKKNILVRASKRANGTLMWEPAVPLELPRHPVVPYAYYPYRPLVELSSGILPIHVSPDAEFTPDSRAGTLASGHKSLSASSPLAILSMKHLLARLTFHLENDTDANPVDTLRSIQVGNAPGKHAFHQHGLYDLVHGHFTGTNGAPGATLLTCDPPSAVGHSLSGPYHIRVLPLTNPLKEGEIELIFHTDRLRYVYRLPAGTHWKSGYDYIYRFLLQNNELILISVKKRRL